MRLFTNATLILSLNLAIISSGCNHPPHGQEESKDSTFLRSGAIVGAIRWDGWVGPLNKAGLEVEYTLGPHQYHHRAPFYSQEIAFDSIQCRGTTQAIMDKEISYAKYGGIDYWAFCWYPPHTGLDTARQLYLASAHKGDVNWCVILGTNPFDYQVDGQWLVGQFKTPFYQKVLNGRPLVFLFPSNDTKAAQIAGLRTLSKEAGVADPYIVAMAFSAKDADSISHTLGANAVSSYASTYNYETGEQFNKVNYAPAVGKSDQAGWLQYKANGKKLVPWITAGWNPKPRIERSVSWGAYYKPNGWAGEATPGEIAQHVQDAVTWTKDHGDAAEANAVLIYAWNEFDEGGWLCPTFGEDTSRLKAIRAVLRKEGN